MDVADGVMTVNKSGGSIETKRSFTNYQLHVEWKVPTNITGSSQARGNSGVFLASTGPGDDGYELQVLDSYENKTYVNAWQAVFTSRQFRWQTRHASPENGRHTTLCGRHLPSTLMAR